MSLLRKWAGSDAAGAQLCRVLATAWEQASGVEAPARPASGAAGKAGGDDGSGNESEDEARRPPGAAALDEQAAGDGEDEDADSLRDDLSELYGDEDDELGERKQNDYEEDSDFWDDDDYVSGEDDEE